MKLQRLALASAIYLTFAGLAFATVSAIAGDLFLMWGFEILSLIGAVAWVIFHYRGVKHETR